MFLSTAHERTQGHEMSRSQCNSLQATETLCPSSVLYSFEARPCLLSDYVEPIKLLLAENTS